MTRRLNELDRLMVECILEKLTNASRSRARTRHIDFSPEEIATLFKMYKIAVSYSTRTILTKSEYATYTY